MSWLAELAGKAEDLLINIDEKAGAALRSGNIKKKNDNITTDPPKKYPIPRNIKRIGPVVETRRHSSNSPSMKESLMAQSKKINTVFPVQIPESKPVRQSGKRSQLNVNNCPKTASDVHFPGVDRFGLRKRRSSLPSDLQAIPHDQMVYKLQNLEVENVMLKNEINVLNKEVSDLLEKYQQMENSSTVDSHVEEFNNARSQFKSNKIDSLMAHNKAITLQYKEIQQKLLEITNSEKKYKDCNDDLLNENQKLTVTNTDLEDRIKQLNEKLTNNKTTEMKLENDLRHTQTRVHELQSLLERSNEECRRLERDWDAYKLRVKNMLLSKDTQIKALQDGANFNEDVRELMNQIEVLKEERDDMSECLSRLRNELDGAKCQMDELDERNSIAQRVVTALRDTLREERAARNMADSQCISLNKELKSQQQETGQTIASLRTALRSKDQELNELKQTMLRSAETSSLNVADYDVQGSIDNEKIQYLSQTLVQKQCKIESLMADNNMLRIQLDKLESKFKTEMSQIRNMQSVVNVDYDNRYRRNNAQESTLSKCSVRLGVILRRNPVFRIFIIFYMLCLHFWVVTVLFTSRPPEEKRYQALQTHI